MNDNNDTQGSDDDFERVARDAASALRRPAPADAVQHLHELRARRQRLRAVGVSMAAIAVVLGGLVAIAARRDPDGAEGSIDTSVGDTATVVDGTTSPSAVTEAMDRLRETARAYADAVLHGTAAQVAAFYSSSCTGPLTDTQLGEVRTAIESAASMPLASISTAVVLVRNFDGSHGDVSVGFNLPPSVQGNDNWLVYQVESGSWRVVDCNRLPFGGNSTQSSSSSVPDPGLAAHIELPVTTAVAGTKLEGFLVVSNNTGAPLHVLDGGCQPKWGVALTNAQYVPNIPFTMECATAPLELPVGETRLPVSILTTYYGCHQGSAEGSGTSIVPACLPSGPPPLPAGKYTTVLVGSIPGLPSPPPVIITLTS